MSYDATHYFVLQSTTAVLWSMKMEMINNRND